MTGQAGEDQSFDSGLVDGGEGGEGDDHIGSDSTMGFNPPCMQADQMDATIVTFFR